MPGAHGQTQINRNTYPTQQAEIIPDLKRTIGEDTFLKTTTQPRTSYLRMHMAQPIVPDETGHMTFRYILRMSAETHVQLHLCPDHIHEHKPEFWNRQIITLSFLVGVNEFQVPCIPYELPNV